MKELMKDTTDNTPQDKTKCHWENRDILKLYACIAAVV